MSVTGLGLTVFEYFRYSALPIEDRDSVGDIFVIPALYMIGFSIVLGIITRFYVLSLKGKGFPFAKRALATTLGFCLLVLLPSSYASIAKRLSQWENRPPSPACNHHYIHVRMSGVDLVVPGLEFVHLAIGDGNHKPEIEQIQKHNVYFRGNKSLRRYCDKYDNGAKKIEATALTIGFRDIPRSLANPDYKAYCQQQPDSSNVFCPADPRKPIIERLHLYVDGKYNAGRMFASWPSSPEKTQAEITKAGNPPLENGLYQSDRNYFWVADNGWTTPDGSPFAMSCFASQEKLYCKTTYRFKDELFTHYGFLVSKETPIADARKIYDKAQSIITSLTTE